MNFIRKAIQPAVSILGMVVVFGGVLLVPATNLRLMIMIVTVGVVILEVGVWGLAESIIPNERLYLSYRAEVNHFMSLVPELNAAALDRDSGAEGGEERFQDTLILMRDSVGHMEEVAGKVG